MWRPVHNPMEDDPAEWERRVDEELAELRWGAFVQVILAFQETEGWSGVLSAVARAMREAEQDRAR